MSLYPPEITNHFFPLKRLGAGQYGDVVLFSRKRDGKKIAVKRMHDILFSDRDRNVVLREIRLLKHLHSPNIVQLEGIICPQMLESKTSEQNADDVERYSEAHCGFNSNRIKFDILLAFDAAPLDLGKYLDNPEIYGVITHREIKIIMYQILLGLKYLHSANVIHRDIKPSNILISLSKVRSVPPAADAVQLADVGLSRVVDLEDVTISPLPLRTSSPVGGSSDPRCGHLAQAFEILPDSVDKSVSEVSPALCSPPAPPKLKRQKTADVVTPTYRAPELILKDSYNASIDIWSLACVFAELFDKEEEGALFSPHGGKQSRLGRLAYLGGGRGRLDKDMEEMSNIIRLVGTPSEEDLADFRPSSADRLRTLFAPRPAASLGDVYPEMEPSGCLDLLRQMLFFDPRKRITALCALRHPCLDEVRAEAEVEAAVCPAPMSVDEEIALESTANLSRSVVHEVLTFPGCFIGDLQLK